MSERTGLVVAGGGTAGVSWAVGLFAGLIAEGAFDPSEPVVVIGTSAGSIVGAHLAAGSDFSALVETERSFRPAPGQGSPSARIDLEIAGFVFKTWTRVDPMTSEASRAIGERALIAPTATPERWIESIEERVPSDGWPDRLVVTTTDITTGERATWSASDGAPLLLAVSASCSVPSIAPAIYIDDRPYMDGGITSVVNADLLARYQVDRAIVVCPQVGILKNVARSALARETRSLEEAGITVTAVVPGESYEALGPDLMDPALRPAAVEEGLHDAKVFAPTLAR